jgi:carbonic anhydrase/acetyltransferase-like protein (isoleucine patch superfamily)
MLHSLQGKRPTLHETAYVAPGAHLIGDVTLGEKASVWFNAVLRGDSNSIRIGAGSNVQDNTTIHVDPGPYDVVVGENVVIGHNCIIHGCHIGDGSLIGMGAIILNGARIGANTLVAAGALVPEHKEFPPGVVLMGAPAKVVREVTAKDLEMMRSGAQNYQRRAEIYRAGGIVG